MTENLLKYRVILGWNGREVCDACVSATLAYTLITHAFVDNFAGETARLGAAIRPTLETILNMYPGDYSEEIIWDETGKAGFHIERLY